MVSASVIVGGIFAIWLSVTALRQIAAAASDISETLRRIESNRPLSGSV